MNQFPTSPHGSAPHFKSFLNGFTAPPAPRALLLSEARQTGKTTLLLQTINELLIKGVAPANILLCQKKSVERGYLITKSLNDFGLVKDANLSKSSIMRIPAPLLCYWVSENELLQGSSF